MSIADDRTASAAALYASTFAGRTDAYALWNGKFWEAIRRPLTADTVITAFRSNIPISGYILNDQSRSHLAVLDFDRDDGFELGMRVLRRMSELSGMAYIERSRRGCHIWIVMSEVRPGILIRRALRQLMDEAGIPLCPGGQRCPECTPPANANTGWRPPTGPHRDPRLEMRPGADYLPVPDEGSPPSLGHCIRMATMPHQKTGQRYVLVSSEGEKLPEKLADMMLNIDWCDVEIMQGLAVRGPEPRLGPPPTDLRYPFGRPINDESASEILRDLWGMADAAPGRLIVCKAHDDKRPSLSILKDDQRAICHSPRCQLHNNGRGRGTHELRSMAPAGTR